MSCCGGKGGGGRRGGRSGLRKRGDNRRGLIRNKKGENKVLKVK